MSNNIFNEKLVIKDFQCKGKITFLKGFEVENIDLKGKVLTLLDSNFVNLNVFGNIEAQNLIGKFLKIKGNITGKNINADNIDIQGSFILDSLKGNNISLKGSKDSHLRNIEADNIEIFGISTDEKEENIEKIDSIFEDTLIQKIKKFINIDEVKKNISTEDSFIYIDKIIGNNIVLQNVIANYVEGAKVETLKGCKIKELKIR